MVEPGNPVAGGEHAQRDAPRVGGTRDRAWVQSALLGATAVTTTWAGALHQGVNLLTEPSAWPRGVPYAAALLAILGVHEMGHYVVARRRGVQVSLPYFIPAPMWLGTFGAFIRMDGAVRSRSSYFDVGIAGPLAGLVVALAALYFGMIFERPTPVSGHGLIPSSSYLFAWIFRLAGGSDAGATVQLGPVAFAGWLGLMVTALNLLPAGQLDGGHIAYATFGPRVAKALSIIVITMLVGAGVLLGSHYWIWGLLIWWIAGTAHPPAVDDSVPLDGRRMLLAAASFALLLAIVLPGIG